MSYTLVDPRTLSVPHAPVEVTEADINHVIAHLQDEHAEWSQTNAPAVLGNRVILDFEGFLDGVAFEGGKGSKYPLVLGSGVFIPGFEDQLVGVSAGESKEVSVSFPQEYHKADLAGKPVVFQCTVHEVEQSTKPEVTAEFLSEMTGENLPDMETARAHVQKLIAENRQEENRIERHNAILAEFARQSEIEVPVAEESVELQHILVEQQQRLARQRLTLEQFLAARKQTLEQFIEEIKPHAQQRAKLRLLLDAFAKEHKIEVSHAEVEEQIKAFQAARPESKDEYIAFYAKIENRRHLIDSLRLDKAVEMVIGMVK